MRNKDNVNDADLALFRDFVHDIKPLPNTKVICPPPTVKPSRKRRVESTEENMPAAPFSDYEKLDAVSSEDQLNYCQLGIPYKTLRKLRASQYNVNAIIDLHGMTVADARDALYAFLLRCHREGIRHALIIHGKGKSMSKPILKNKLNHWLRETDLVLAFCSAAAKDGRSGSLCVLIKQQKAEMAL